MKTVVNCALLVLALVASRSFAEEHAYAKAKVGEWVSHQMAMNAGGVEQKMEMKQTVVKKTDDEVTIEIAMKMSGFEIPPQTQVYKLKEKYDPVKGTDQNAKVTQLGAGEETLTLGGKTYKTKWVSAEVEGKEGKVKSKVWTSPEVPLNGMVKMEAEGGPAGKTTMELTGSGSK